MPPPPPPPRAPFKERGRGERAGGRGGRSRAPAPRAHLRRPGLRSGCRLRRAPSPVRPLRARGSGQRAPAGRAPGGARFNLVGPAPPAARPAPEWAKLGAGAGGGGPRRLPGAAEPLRSPSPPLPCAPRPARPGTPPAGALGWEGTRGAAGEGALSRYLLPSPPCVPPHPAAPVCSRAPSEDQLRSCPALGQLPEGAPRGAPALGWRRGVRGRGVINFVKMTPPSSLKAYF